MELRTKAEFQSRRVELRVAQILTIARDQHITETQDYPGIISLFPRSRHDCRVNSVIGWILGAVYRVQRWFLHHRAIGGE
ncbi:hypothetical protein [Thermoleptolyngbya sp.]